MGLGLGKIEAAKNTPTMIADALRSAILQGKLTSGQSLKQDVIASEFQVSKIPVREALVQLQAEGLVTILPNRSARVSHLSIAEVDEIYTLRRSLEPIALRRAVPHLVNADFVQIDHILDTIDNETDLTRWAQLNWEFHARLYQPAKMPRLIQITQNLHNNVARYLLNYLDQDYLKESQRQHREIVALSRSGDVEAACEALERHLGDPVDVFATLLEPGK